MPRCYKGEDKERIDGTYGKENVNAYKNCSGRLEWHLEAEAQNGRSTLDH